VKAAGIANERSRVKRHEIQRGIAQGLARFGIAGEKDLEPTIELKTLYAICADPPTDAVGSLKDRAGEA
jgi:hypothetical protein